MNRVDLLLKVLLDYAPNRAAQELVVKTLWDIQKDCGNNKNEVAKQLIIALHDGTAYGNWIWNMKVTTNKN